LTGPGTIREVRIPADGNILEGSLRLPTDSCGVVLFAHGSGSSRHSPRNNYVAGELARHGIGTLLFDLLTAEEDVAYSTRFDIELLTRRLLQATDWLRTASRVGARPLGYFGASTGAAAALQAAAEQGPSIKAVVSRGGRPDLAGEVALAAVTAPTLLIVGSRDDVVLDLNRKAARAMTCANELKVIPGATHLFEEPGTLEQAAIAACDWFGTYLRP
jgi:putative phosphoribosyl transferase